MAGTSFTQQVRDELKAFGAKASNAVTRAAKAGWKVAVDNTPRLTGNLQNSWKLSRERRSSYVPKPGNKPKPQMPDFTFRITKDKRFYLYNNVPYASHVENGDGPGNRTPSHAMLKARIKIESELDKELGKIK